jgi:glutaredoxin
MMTPKLIAICATLAAGLACTALPAQAQQMYRIVGPDGKVTFSDKPPAANDAKVTPARRGKFAADANNSGLPADVRSAANNYPVTLYTGKSCEPCNSARNLLTNRGVPFTEKTVESAEDTDAFTKLGADALPLATVGGKQLKGYSESEWDQYLDAAGYPQKSQLPASYRNPAPSPLAARAAPTASPAPAEPAEAAAPRSTAAPATSPSNPAGIKF